MRGSSGLIVDRLASSINGSRLQGAPTLDQSPFQAWERLAGAMPVVAGMRLLDTNLLI